MHMYMLLLCMYIWVEVAFVRQAAANACDTERVGPRGGRPQHFCAVSVTSHYTEGLPSCGRAGSYCTWNRRSTVVVVDGARQRPVT